MLKKLIWLAFAFILSFSLIYFWHFGFFKFSSFSTDWGNFGNYIGGISPFLSFLALIAVYITFKRDRFETNIFQLLNLHNNLIKTLSYTEINKWTDENGEVTMEPEKFEGREVFSKFKRDLMYELHGINANKDIVLEIKERYESYFFVADKKNVIGNYFRNLYHIINYIDESGFDFEYKKRFTRIIRAQLSNDELILLLCNGLSQYGKDFAKLIYKYDLLQNGDFSKLKLPNGKWKEIYKQVIE